MVIAVFDKNIKYVTTDRLWQWSYGQILRIQGLQLPPAVEIHFSKTEDSGDSVTRIGVTKDGVTDVLIPDSMLESTGSIYAFVYLRTESAGETKYKMMIPLKERPKPEIPGTSEEGGIFEEVVQSVRESAEQAQESARKAGEIKESVQDMVDTISGIDEQVQAVKEYSEQATTAAENAALSETEVKKSESAAKQAKTDAESAKKSAESAASSAKQSEMAVEKARQEVADNKSAVQQVVSEFEDVTNEAVQNITSTATTQLQSIRTAGAEEVEKVQQATAEAVKGKLDKQQGAENAGKALVIGADGNVVPGEVQSSGGSDGIAIVNSASGESPLVISDSAERTIVDFGLMGNTEQFSTTGANLLGTNEITNLSKDSNSPDVYRFENDTIIAEKESGTSNQMYFLFPVKLPLGTYYFSFEKARIIVLGETTKKDKKVDVIRFFKNGGGCSRWFNC